MSKPTQRLITRTEAAREKGCTSQAIGHAAYGALADACVGKQIDANHPAFVSWQPRADRRRTQQAHPHYSESGDPTGDRPFDDDDDPQAEAISEAKDLSVGRRVPVEELHWIAEQLQPLLQKYGTAPGFSKWLTSLKTLEEILSKRLDNERERGQLIDRDMVRASVFAALDGMNQKLLRDLPVTLARIIYRKAQAGESLESAEAEIRKLISDYLTPIKNKAARSLREQE